MNILYQEWLNRNAGRAFPFSDSADFSCLEGAPLPYGVVLDARACFLSNKYSGTLSVESIGISDNRMTIDFLLGPSFHVSGIVEPDGTLHHKSEDADVRFICTPLSEIPEDRRRETYTLKTPLEVLPSRVVFIPWGCGVDSIACDGVVANGKIHLEDGHNTRLRLDGDKIRLDPGVGYGKGVICRKQYLPEVPSRENGAPEILSTPVPTTPVRYFCGQKPDPDGSFQIYAGEGVTVRTGVQWGIPTVDIGTSATVEAIAGLSLSTNKDGSLIG